VFWQPRKAGELALTESLFSFVMLRIKLHMVASATELHPQSESFLPVVLKKACSLQASNLWAGLRLFSTSTGLIYQPRYVWPSMMRSVWIRPLP
jgi:hypothetical protein